MGKKSARLAAATDAIDPTLDALFSASAGPVKAPPKSRYSSLLEKKDRESEDTKPKQNGNEEDDGEDDDEDLSEGSEELDYEDEGGEDAFDAEEQEEEDSDASASSEDADETNGDLNETAASTEPVQPKRERKRKRKEDNEDLEGKWLSKITKEDTPEPAEKRHKSAAADEESSDEEIPQHESLSKDSKSSDLEKADRTVFLANVSTEAISSKSAKKTLLQHLASVLDQDSGEKVESIRFRSVAFAGASMPKRAAFITKQLMDSTTKSTNAYAVYSTPTASRKAVTKLNGTEILGRHIRVDSVAHPTPTDHRRCVFVGNLGFVDDETVVNTNKDGETVEKKRNKVPSDIEEGLWRTFGKQGKVENVRVVRDPKTRVGKGFAYVQFYDGNSVESALLLDGKKFPPMLPRALRVTRAKDPRKTAQAQEREKEKLSKAMASVKSTKYKHKATPEEKSLAGRASKLLGRSAAAAGRRKGAGKDSFRGRSAVHADNDGDVAMKTPEQIVFEGTRARSTNGPPKGFKGGKKGKAKMGKPQNRGARRAAEWKKKKN